MTDLKPCPFCGVQPEVEHYETFDNDEWYIGCDCECGPCTKTHLTYEQAVAAWNVRAERTCELEMNIDLTAIQCDRCGYKLPKGTELEKVRFCAGCGAKVVSE